MRWLLGAVVAGAAVVALAPPAKADVVAYLVNVHVRPGYNFPNAEAAIGYGNSICDRVAAKMSYAQLVDEVKADFNSTDYYQGAYLINQAVNELCPAQIWQLRQSAAGYTLPAGLSRQRRRPCRERRRSNEFGVPGYGQVTAISNGLFT